MPENNQVQPEEAKSFDLALLAEKLKAKGLPAIEGLAKASLEAVFEWIEESVQASPSKIDDFALAVLPPLKSLIMSKVDEISK
jgi:hypothetical protein